MGVGGGVLLGQSYDASFAPLMAGGVGVGGFDLSREGLSLASGCCREVVKAPRKCAVVRAMRFVWGGMVRGGGCAGARFWALGGHADRGGGSRLGCDFSLPRVGVQRRIRCCSAAKRRPGPRCNNS